MGVKRKLLIAGGDVLLAALVMLGVWVTGYRLPQKGISAAALAEQLAGGVPGSVSGAKGNSALARIGQEKLLSTQAAAWDGAGVKTDMALSAEDWHKKFADKFTEQVVSTQDSYTSPDLSIHLTRSSYDSGTIDTTENGKHKKYGSKVAYTIADIYIGDITCLQTAFAQDTYGVGYEEKLSSMSKRIGAVLAVNGDSYSNNRHKDNGTIIRNGTIYRAKPGDAETCVLNWDGTMKIYDPGIVDKNQLIADGAYQSWVFGPSLLDNNGKAKTSFITWDYIRESHPRTAIGYYEPGHYCLLLVDGRQADYSRGMFLEEMAAVFEKLGCKLAYNLDGGHCSFMTFQGGSANHPYKPDHTVQDGIFVTEGLA